MTDPTNPDPVASHDATTHGQSPRAPRASVMLSAIVERFGTDEPTRHRVRDLSAGGVRIDQAGGFPVGATVLVTVGALESIGATVVWTRDGSAGLKFAHQIDPAQARSKAAIAPRATDERSVDPKRPTPTAGWIPDMQNAYRR